MIFQREWAMPNKHTFLILPIGDLIKRVVGDGKGWIDPFAGENSPAEIKNDLNPEKPTEHHLDALDFLRMFDDESVDGVIYDPPYSITQARQIYNHFGADRFNVSSMGYWGDLKKEISRIVKLNGRVVCCGWNTNGIGKTRMFRIDEILIVPHGGSKNDTIVTVETKIGSQRELF